MYKSALVLFYWACSVPGRRVRDWRGQQQHETSGWSKISLEALVVLLREFNAAGVVVGSHSGRSKPPCCVVTADLEARLQINIDEHAAEYRDSLGKGFTSPEAAVPVGQPTASYQVPRKVLGMGKECPFDTDELIFASPQLFTASECRKVREEAAARIAAGGQSTFTMTDTNNDVLLHHLPETLRWLNEDAFARVASFAAQCFPSAVKDATDLWIYRGLVIHYDAAAGLSHQPIHRDGSLISCVMPLNERCEYEGGGTYIEHLNRSIALDQGCALFHPSAVRHSGHRINSGERWVFVLFLNCKKMHHGEHGRYFQSRAKKHMEHSLSTPARENLEYALQVTGESDSTVWFDLGVLCHERAEFDKALQHYRRAEALNPRSPTTLTNMGKVFLELERREESYRYFARALEEDPHMAEARFRMAAIQIERDELLEAGALLIDAPEDSMQHEGVRVLLQELNSVGVIGMVRQQRAMV